MQGYLYPADVALHRGGSVIARGIQECQRERGEGKSVVNHVSILSEAGTVYTAHCIESLATGTKEHLFNRYIKADVSTIVFRNVLITDAERMKVEYKARQYVGRRYGYLKVAAHFADYALGGKYMFRKMCRMENYPICSWVVGHAYESIALRFKGLSANVVQPDDIWDHIMAHLGEWEQVALI